MFLIRLKNKFGIWGINRCWYDNDELSKQPFHSVEDFDNRVIKPVINFIQKSPRGNIYKILPFRRDPSRFSRVLDEELFENMSFNELVLTPEWVCYATSLNSAYSWKFSQNEIGDSTTGHTQPTQDDRLQWE